MNEKSLLRFLDAQNQMYLTALDEIQHARKKSHWMWFIFPQLKGLGRSSTAQFYGLRDLEEAVAYWEHPVLGPHLQEMCTALLALNATNANAIFGTPDDLKLRSCMTLFSKVPQGSPVFQKVLDRFFDGVPDARTLALLQKT